MNVVNPWEVSARGPCEHSLIALYIEFFFGDDGETETIDSTIDSVATGLGGDNVSLKSMTTSDAQMLHKGCYYPIKANEVMLFVGALAGFVF